MEKIVGRIPASLWTVASEKLTDVILNSPNADRIPSHLAKTMLYYWQRDQLATEIGLQLLLEASMKIDSEKTLIAIEELGLHEVVAMLKETM